MVNTSLVKSKVLDKTPIYAKISNPILYPDFYHPQSSSMFICIRIVGWISAQHIYRVYLKLNKIFIFALTKLSILLALFRCYTPHTSSLQQNLIFYRVNFHFVYSYFLCVLYKFSFFFFFSIVCMLCGYMQKWKSITFCMKVEMDKRKMYKIPLVLEEERGFVWNLQINVSRLRDGQGDSKIFATHD